MKNTNIKCCVYTKHLYEDLIYIFFFFIKLKYKQYNIYICLILKNIGIIDI